MAKSRRPAFQSSASDADSGPSIWLPFWLFGISNRRLDVILSVLVLAIVIVSRIAAFPSSGWEQDEAYFTAAVHEIDVTDSRPHPPWFPLWIAMGSTLHATGLDPSLALRIPAVFFSLWMFVALRALWLRFLPPPDALAASLLFAATPAAWWFSGRAFTGTAATAMMVSGLACWLSTSNASRRVLALGSVAFAASFLIRPQFLLPIGAAVILGLRRRSWVERRAMLVPGAVLAASVVFGLVLICGGLSPLAQALTEHAEYHFGHLTDVEWSFSNSGLARSLGHPVAAGIWLALCIAGGSRLVRTGSDRSALRTLWFVLTGLLILVYGFSNPCHARYFIPILALTAGLATAAVRCTWRWSGLLLALVSAVGWGLWIVPSLAEYRNTDAPPIRALRFAISEAGRTGAVVVVDSTLDAFVKGEQALGYLTAPVILWPLIEQGAVAAPPPEFTVTVTDVASRNRPIAAESSHRFSSDLAPAHTLGQNRYLDLTVSTGARLRSPAKNQGPLILVD